MIPPVSFTDRSEFKQRMIELLEVDPRTTVALTVDMQRDYLDPEIATSPVDAVQTDRVLAGTVSLLAGLRALDIPIVHAYVARRPIEHARGFAGSAYSRVGQGAHLSQNINAPVRSKPDRVEGSQESMLPDVLVGPDDVHVTTKKVMDSFHGSDLDILLQRALKPTTLVIMGINTDTCVHSTAFSAANRGYQVVLAADATGSMRGEDHHWMALELMSRTFAWVMTNEQILSRLRLEPTPQLGLTGAP